MNRTISRKRPGGRNQKQNSLNSKPRRNRRRNGRRANQGGMPRTVAFGMGEQRGILAPVASGSVQGASRPTITSSSTDGDLRVRIRHREYITDVTSSVAFACTQYNINPGLALLFPWLSQLANLFESYLVNGLRFQFRTESPTSQAGKIMLMADWDALDAAPLSKVAMMQERTKADGPVWVDLDMNCDLADLRKFGVQRYVRGGAAPANTDLKTYDVGTLNVATQGVTNTPTIGELWVEYDIELITPNTSPQATGAAVGSSQKITSAGGSISNSAVFGAAPTTTVYGTQIATPTPASSTLVFNVLGQYFVEFDITGSLTAMTGTTGTATVTANECTGNGSNASVSFLVEVTALNQTLILTAPTGTVTACSTRIAQYSYALS